MRLGGRWWDMWRGRHHRDGEGGGRVSKGWEDNRLEQATCLPTTYPLPLLSLWQQAGRNIFKMTLQKLGSIHG